MFPRTRRCLTGTHTRPIVTARTSKLPSLFIAPTWIRYLSAAALQDELRAEDARPNPSNRRAPASEAIDTHNEESTAESATRRVTSRAVVRSAIQRRKSKLPRSSRASTIITAYDAEQDFVPTYLTARKNLTPTVLTQNGQIQDLLNPLPKSERFISKKPDWIVLAKFLAKIPTFGQSTIQESVAVNRETLQAYTGSYRANAWSETVGAGVHVELPAESDNESTTRSTVFTGSQYYKTFIIDKYVGSGNRKPATPETFHYGQADVLTSVNSVATFNRFVFRLTHRYVNRNVETDLYGDFNRYAADLLCWMFSDSEMSRYASTVALNRALIFLHSHIELLQAAELVFAEGQRMFLVRNVTTSNLRLSFALRHDLETIAYATARDMLHFKIQPNSRTWSMVYAASRAPWERKLIINLIQKQNVDMTDSAWSQFASVTLEERLTTIGNDPEELNSIVADLDNAFGLKWLTMQTCYRAFHICNRRRLFDVAQRLSELADTRGITASRNSHVHNFALLRRRKDIDGAINLLATMRSDNDAIHYKWVIPYMFMTAWERNRTNVCHLLWVFAATRGLITRLMRTVVTKALLSNTVGKVKLDRVSQSQLRRSAWQRMAARVICGIDEKAIARGTDSGTCFPRLHAYVSSRKGYFGGNPSIAELLMQWTPDDGTRDEQLSLVYVMIGDDINAWKTFDQMSVDVLLEQLPLALERDKQWTSVERLEKLTRRDTYVVRRECRGALEDCLPKRTHKQWSYRTWLVRQVVLRNMEAVGLKRKEHKDFPHVESLETLSRIKYRGEQAEGRANKLPDDEFPTNEHRGERVESEANDPE